MEQDKKNNANREYKDSVFVDLFSRDEKTRENAVIPLYNALHERKISTKDKIEFIYLADVLFRKVRNDVSFIVNNRLVVFLEHQSTINPNMPFRFLEYVLALYKILIDQRAKFSQKKICIPKPEFYVIYNGKVPYPAKKELHLSDLFESSKEKSKRKGPQLELTVTVININHPDNQDFLNSCSLLNGYKKLTDRIEKYKALYGDAGYAMAIEECIKENIEISEYLKRKIQEVIEMFSSEYSYALELEASKEDGRIEGIREGVLNTATRMKNNSFDVPTIMKITGLSRETIEKL